MNGHESLTGQDRNTCCRTKLMALLSVRERCAKELRDRLLREGFDLATVEEQIAWASSTNLLNEQRFAEAYIAGKLHSGWGRARIERELRKLEIDLGSLSGYPDTLFPEDEYLRAQSVAQKVSQQSKNRREATYRKLMSRGFSPEVACTVAKESSRSSIDESDSPSC